MEMRVRCRVETLAVRVTIGCVVASYPGMAGAQGIVIAPYTSHSHTVSVASLRIPDRAWAHLGKAQEAVQRHNEKEYEAELQKALEIAPQFSAALLLRASRNVTRHQFDAAITDALAARKADPGIMWGTVVLASALNGLHRYKDARVLLDNLHGPEAGTWQAVYEAARAHTGCHDVEEALRLSAAALGAAPKEFADVHLMRSNALLLSRRYSESLDQLNAYIANAGDQGNRAEVLSAVEAVRLKVKNDEVVKAGSVPGS